MIMAGPFSFQSAFFRAGDLDGASHSGEENRMIQRRKIRDDASSATAGSSNVSVPTKKRLPAMPCASAECADTTSAKANITLRIDPLRIAAPAMCDIAYPASESQGMGC